MHPTTEPSLHGLQYGVLMASLSAMLSAACGSAQCLVELQPDGPTGSYAAAVSLGQARAIVGCRRYEVAYIFADRDGRWTEEASVQPSDTSDHDWFGFSVQIKGRTAAVGAPKHDHGTRRGSVYVFRHMEGNWTELTELVSPYDDGSFGESIAMNRDWLVVGVPGVGLLGTVEVYRFDGDRILHEATLLPEQSDDNDDFGAAVAIDGNRIVVGGIEADRYAGAAYTYVYENDEWTHEQTILSPERGAWFGCDVALSGDTLVVGALNAMMNGEDVGAALVYGFRDGQWQLDVELRPEENSGRISYGSCVDIQGDLVIVTSDGARSFAYPGESLSIYRRDIDGRWIQRGLLFHNVLAATPALGEGLSIRDSKVMFSAFRWGGNGCYGALTDLNCGPVLSLQSYCTDPTYPATLSWSLAEPNGTIAIIYSDQIGRTRIPQSFNCAGTWLDLNTPIRVVYQGDSGEGGFGLLYARDYAEFCNGYLQLIDLSTCRTSNTIRLE